jgi:hypothetical protein
MLLRSFALSSDGRALGEPPSNTSAMTTSKMIALNQ